MVVRGKSSNIARTSCGQKNVYLPFQMEKKRTTLNNVCSTLGVVQCIGVRGCSVHGGFSALEFHIECIVDIFINALARYQDLCGWISWVHWGCSVHSWDIINALGDIVYVTKHLQCTYPCTNHDISQCTVDIHPIH